MSKQHIRQKFQNGAHVHLKERSNTANLRGTVVVGKPDANGQIVIINRYDEYSLVHQDGMEKADE